MKSWNAAARPVPISTTMAAQAALAQEADALVVDVAGPVQVPIEGAALHRVASGQRLTLTTAGWVWTATVGGHGVKG